MPHMLTLPKTVWKDYFDRMSSALVGQWAEIEVTSLDLGDQIVAEWIPMIGISYDSKDDLVDVALDRVRHLIRQPREVVIGEGPIGIASVAIVDAEGRKQVVRLKEPLRLPAAATSR